LALLRVSSLAQFPPALVLVDPAPPRLGRGVNAIIDLISLRTGGPPYCRACRTPGGTPAPKAAGKIHSDIERGFIRAEVVPWQDLVELGSEARCREAGKLRVEGKGYVIQDGDVVNFRFNV
jgi:ribosome-binding ATPase YchF (GTP1/OBG family)